MICSALPAYKDREYRAKDAWQKVDVLCRCKPESQTSLDKGQKKRRFNRTNHNELLGEVGEVPESAFTALGGLLTLDRKGLEAGQGFWEEHFDFFL
jgi:hypothetical protein